MKICSKCGNNINRLKTKAPPICAKCYKIPKQKCIKCGKFKTPHKKQDGGTICRNCYHTKKQICIKCKEIKEIYKKGPLCKECCYEECVICKIKSNVVQRLQDGSGLCKSCYQPPKDFCFKCGTLSKIQKITDNGPICMKCYNPPQRRCSICGVIGLIAKENVCKNCYKSPCHKCSVCGMIKIAWLHKDNITLCHMCYYNDKRNNDEKFRIMCNLRCLVNNSLNKYLSNGKVLPSNKYGIDYKAIMDFIGLCPGNRNEYHIDHIFPLSAFDFNNYKHIEIAFAPDNHQWLKKEDNLKKNNKCDIKLFEEFLKKHGC